MRKFLSNFLIICNAEGIYPRKSTHGKEERNHRREKMDGNAQIMDEQVVGGKKLRI